MNHYVIVVGVINVRLFLYFRGGFDHITFDKGFKTKFKRRVTSRMKQRYIGDNSLNPDKYVF